VESIWSFDDEPICICLDDADNVYVSTERYLDGREEGRITKFSKSNDGRWGATETLGAQGLLNRPFGMTWHNDALYIARSGRLVHATPSGLQYGDAGAITQCRDLDGNGIFEQFIDVVDQLPGYGGPIPTHGLNGVDFDRAGNMYVIVGSPSERALEQKPLEGKVLRYRPGEKTPEVFASGFRNAFGFHMNARDELFVTDNDVESNPGDELIHVVEGGHYGHPYVIPGEHDHADSRFRPAMYVGNKRGNLVGLTLRRRSCIP
jgi:glucose/arabinose dehydrogenase